MKNQNQAFHKSIVKFIETNPDFFTDFLNAHTKAQTLLRSKLNKLIATISMEDLDALGSNEDRQTIIDLGSHVRSLHKALKKKVVAEYIITHLNLELMLCRLSKDARDFFYIKQGMGSTERFDELIERYKKDGLSEFDTLELYETIRDWQRAFNNHHLMRYDQIFFDMSYKTLKTIGEDCHQKTYGTYSNINFNEQGITITKKDGTQVNSWD